MKLLVNGCPVCKKYFETILCANDTVRAFHPSHYSKWLLKGVSDWQLGLSGFCDGGVLP